MRLFVFNLTTKNITLSTHIVISSISTKFFYYSDPKFINNMKEIKISIKNHFKNNFFLNFLRKTYKGKCLKPERTSLLTKSGQIYFSKQKR